MSRDKPTDHIIAFGRRKKNPSPLDKLLNEMGNTPEEVAQYLRGANIKGLRKSSEYCPVAILINEKNVTWPRARVANGFVIFNDVQIFDCPLPEPVKVFIKKFDSGEFSFLYAGNR